MLLPHFTGEEIEAHRGGVTCMRTQLVGDSVGAGPQTVLLGLKGKDPD